MTFVLWERGPPRAESKDPPKSETEPHGTLSGFGGTRDSGVALLRLHSG